MKPMLLILLLGGCILASGCQKEVVVPEGPLPTSSATVAPPPACQALRKRGGSC